MASKRNSSWSDLSGFEFNLSPVDYTATTFEQAKAGLNNRGLRREEFYNAWYPENDGGESWQKWGNWLDKFETDVRFAAVSDENAFLYGFPEVDAPWKFTEYTFKGVRSVSNIIEPQLYSPSTLEVINDSGEGVLDGNELFYYETLYMYEGSSGAIKTQEEWEELNWTDEAATENKNTFTRLEEYTKKAVFKYPSSQKGVRLYKQQLEVESIKMGEHGNIPPNTINMSAPSEYFNPENIYSTVVVPKYTATAGNSVYNETDGIIDFTNGPVWRGLRKILIDPIDSYTSISPSGLVGTKDERWSITTVGNPVQQPGPKFSKENILSIKYLQAGFTDGDLVHSGCQFWTGTESDVGCSLAADLGPNDVQSVPNPSLCTLYSGSEIGSKEYYNQQGGTCPYYSSSGPRQIALYESSAKTTAEWAAMYAGKDDYDWAGGANNYVDGGAVFSSTNTPLGGGALAYGGFALGAAAALNSPTSQPREFGDTSLRWEVEYELQKIPVEGREIKQTGRSVLEGKLAYYERGTGVFAIDSRQNNYGGIDHNFFGDRNMMSAWRWNNKIMPCYNAEKCNLAYGHKMMGGNPSTGAAGINGQDHCKYYTQMCPYLNVPRRALEYDYNYKQLLSLVLDEFRLGGIDSLGLSEYKISGSTISEVTEAPANPSGVFVAIGSSAQLSGIEKIEDVPSAGLNVYFYYTVSKYDQNHKSSDVFAHIEQYNHDNQKVFMTMPSGVAVPTGYPTDIPWLVKLYDDYVSPVDFFSFITNEKKFFGGRSPEYRDLSKMGDEILCIQGAGGGMDDTTNGGKGGHPLNASQDKGFYRGYYPDIDGEAIVDGRALGDPAPSGYVLDPEWQSADPFGIDPPATGYTFKIPSLSGRTTGKPKTVDGATCISGAVSNTFMSPQRTTSPNVTQVFMYSSDTREILDCAAIREQYNDSGNLISPNNIPAGQLPIERKYYRCPTCSEPYLGLDMNQADIDPSGVSASGVYKVNRYVNQEFTDLEFEALGGVCPSCGDTLVEEGYWTHFPRVNARGIVSVFGLPGQTIREDGYYWKSPTVVNSGHVRQILSKLGDFNEGRTGYKLDETSESGASASGVIKLPPASGNYLTEGLPEPSGKWEGVTFEKYPQSDDDIIDIDFTIEGTTVEFSRDDARSQDALKDAGMTLKTERLDGGTYRDDILSPYDADVDGLDMITVNHLKKLRNMICPLYAYPVGKKVTGDYHRKKQVSHSHRYDPYVYREFKNEPGTLEPQVIAATESGGDVWVQYWDGKFPPTYIHEFFPCGSSWWRINQTIGGITRDGGISSVHMDAAPTEEGVRVYPGSGGYGGYTGNVNSKCYFFLHGYLPLDKEIAKAYVIIRPAGEPAHGGVGTVWTGARLWNHYHPFRTKHEGHGYHDNFYESFGDEEEKPIRQEWIDDQPYSSGQEVYASYKWDSKTQFDAKMQDISTFYDDDYGFTGALSNWGHTLSWDGFAEPILQNYTEEKLWKKYTFDEFKNEVSQNLVKCKFVAGDPEMGGSSYHFYQFSEKMLRNFLNNESQPIPGYFNMDGLNNKMMYPKSGPVIETKSVNTSWAEGEQLIIQAEAGSTFNAESWSDGGWGGASAGSVPRVMDITNLVKKKYNARVDRAYKLSTGIGYGELHDRVYDDRNRAGFTDTYDDPDKGVNYRYWKQGYGQWLNDPWHYPELVNDKFKTIISGDQYAADPSGRISEVSEWYKEVGVDDDTHPDWYKYHPWNLIEPDNDEYNSGKPAPSGYWYVLSSSNRSQYFSMDLRNFPIENIRRNWRYEAGHWDVSNVVCPNKNCTVNIKGLSVAQFITYAQNGGRTNVIPSTTAKNCAVCGTDLTQEPATGAFYVGGDGILTTFYDEHFNEDSFITAIAVHPTDGEDGLSFVKQGFSIEVKSSTNYKWRELFSVDYNETTAKWEYKKYQNKQLVTVSSDNLPTLFTGKWVNGEDLDGVAADYLDDHHFVVPYVRHIRYKSKPKSIEVSHPSASGVGFVGTTLTPEKFIMPSGYEVIDSQYVDGVLEFLDSNRDVTDTFPIISNTDLEIFSSARIVSESAYQYWRIRKTFNVSCCTKFEVYGYENKPSYLMMTDDASSYEDILTVGNNTIVMDNFPTKILSVRCGFADYASIDMVEVYDLGSPDFVWKTITKTDGGTGKEYQEIESGAYFFDPRTASITVPTSWKNVSDSSKSGLFWALNEEVPELEFPTVPNFIQIRYFYGIGKPVTLTATAEGVGPSYQVEKEAICNIAGYEHPDDTTPAGIPVSSSTSLPVIGKSVKLGDNEESKENIYWQVYNHKPMNGEFSMAYIVGDELPAKGWTDSDIAKLFGGDTQEKPLESSKIQGKASGEVTLYGSPNTIISGDLYVYAKAMTQREYIAGGEKVVTYERTGGLKYTGFSIGVELEDVVDNRQGLCYEIPEILVYMRERDNTEIPEME